MCIRDRWSCVDCCVDYGLDRLYLIPKSQNLRSPSSTRNHARLRIYAAVNCYDVFTAVVLFFDYRTTNQIMTWVKLWKEKEQPNHDHPTEQQAYLVPGTIRYINMNRTYLVLFFFPSHLSSPFLSLSPRCMYVRIYSHIHTLLFNIFFAAVTHAVEYASVSEDWDHATANTGPGTLYLTARHRGSRSEL